MTKTCPFCKMKFNNRPHQQSCDTCHEARLAEQHRRQGLKYRNKYKEELKVKRATYLEKTKEHTLATQKAYRLARQKPAKPCPCGNFKDSTKILCDECRVASLKASSKKYYWKNWEKMQARNKKFRELKKNETINLLNNQ